MPEKFLLKVFSGLQFGAEVALDEGEYAIGSGLDDDIQLKDASLNSQHAFLRVESEKIEIRANSGAILFGNGLTLEAGDDRWVEIDQLSPLVLGSTRLAFGLEGANWNTITADAAFRSEVQPNYGKPFPAAEASDRPKSILEMVGINTDQIEAIKRFVDPLIARAINDRRVLYAGAGGLAALLVIIILLQAIFGGPTGPIVRNPVKDKQAIETALAELPFASHIRVVQDVDGQISVRGIIKDVAERRAILSAVQTTGVPVKTRISSAENIATDIDNLILSESLNVKANLKDDGSLVLSGVINDPIAAAKFIELVKAQVVGPTSFDFTRLKDGNALLAEVIRFAHDEGLGPTVSFTLGKNGAYIEATGNLLPDQNEIWANFLKNYNASFAPRIKLRTTVEVSKPSANIGTPGEEAAPVTTADGRILDVATLKSASAKGKGTIPLASSTVEANNPASPDPKGNSAPATSPDGTGPPPLAIQQVSLQASTSQGGGRVVQSEQVAAAPVQSGTSDAQPVEMREPLGAEAIEDTSIINECTGDHIRNFDDLSEVIAKIDTLSTMNGNSITSFGKKEQLTLAEVILNPSLLKRCLAETSSAELAELKKKSPFLTEIDVNPEFIRFIFKDIKPATLILSGVDLTGAVSIMDKAGHRLKKGSSIDIYSRVFNIAELGVIVETAAGMEVAIFDKNLPWMIRPSNR